MGVTGKPCRWTRRRLQPSWLNMALFLLASTRQVVLSAFSSPGCNSTSGGSPIRGTAPQLSTMGCCWLDSERKMDKSIGSSRTAGAANGENLDTFDSYAELASAG